MTSFEPHRVELVWPGKQRRSTTVADARPAPPPLQVVGQHGELRESNGWRSQLVLGDNLDVIQALLPRFGGRTQLIYVDPPFATGGQFRLSSVTGDADDDVSASLAAPGSAPASAPAGAPAFSDRWANDGAEYLQFLFARLPLLKALLAPTGTMFVHCDPRMDWAVRCLLDEVFGQQRLINQIVWHYTGGGRSRRYFSRKHDLIFWVANGDHWIFNIDAVRQPYRASSGYARAGIKARSGKHYLPHPAGTPADDVWDIPILNPMARERLGYPTQKPEQLLERIILAASNPDDLVADLFCGSGTTLAVAERLGRRWLGCDQSPAAVAIARRRILDMAGHRPFEVLHCLEAGRDDAEAASNTTTAHSPTTP